MKKSKIKTKQNKTPKLHLFVLYIMETEFDCRYLQDHCVYYLFECRSASYATGRGNFLNLSGIKLNLPVDFSISIHKLHNKLYLRIFFIQIKSFCAILLTVRLLERVVTKANE